MKIENLKTWHKILITVVAAVVTFWLLGCSQPTKEHYVAPASTPSNGITDEAYLKNSYVIYNQEYFHNRLPSNTIIELVDDDTSARMASTSQLGDGTFIIQFEKKYILAPRIAAYVELHEMCHIKAWDKDVRGAGMTQDEADHGLVWRSCMLQLDAEGALREIFIDEYVETMP
jgi:hypothetical protein